MWGLAASTSLMRRLRKVSHSYPTLDGYASGAISLFAVTIKPSGGLKLFALAGYVQADDGRLGEAPGSLTGVIGAAPVF